MRTLIRAAATAYALAATAQAVLAQCPDGSIPPCRPRTPAPRVDSQAIVVLPFAVRGPESVQYFGDGMVHLFHIALDGTGGLRVIHPPTALKRLHVLKDPTDIIAAAPVARGLGARFVIGGTIVAVGSELRLNAELYDAVEGKRVLPANGRGDATHMGSVVDSIATLFVLRGAPPRVASGRDHGMYISRSPSAVQAYLVAEQLIRTGNWQVGADSLKSSIRQDPDFGWPYFTLLRVMGNHQGYNYGVPPGVLLDSANARGSRFPPRVRGLVQAQAAQGSGRRRRTIEFVDELARQYPNDADVAYLVADVHFHFGLNLGESRLDVLRMLGRAIALDPEQPEAYDHYIGLLGELRDTTAFWSVLHHADSLTPDRPRRGMELEGRVVFREEDPARLVTGLRELQGNFGAYGVESGVLRQLADHDPAEGVRIVDSIAAVVLAEATTDATRVYELQRRSQLAIAAGRYRDAWNLLDRARAIDSTMGATSRAILYASITGQRQPVAEELSRRPQPQTSPPARLSSILLFSISYAPAESAEARIARLPQPPRDTVRAAAMATGMRGLLALRQGDSVRARALLLQAREVHVRQIGTDSNLWPSVPFALALTRLDLAAGDARAAQLHLADAYPGHETMIYYPDIEELRARTCEALGDIDCARRSWSNLAKLLEHADPELLPRRDAARASAARLVRP